MGLITRTPISTCNNTNPLDTSSILNVMMNWIASMQSCLQVLMVEHTIDIAKNGTQSTCWWLQLILFWVQQWPQSQPIQEIGSSKPTQTQQLTWLAFKFLKQSCYMSCNNMLDKVTLCLIWQFQRYKSWKLNNMPTTESTSVPSMLKHMCVFFQEPPCCLTGQQHPQAVAHGSGIRWNFDW